MFAIILLDSLNIDINLTQHKIHLISYKCEHFQQNILKKSCFLYQNHTSNFIFQNSKISDAPLRRFLTA